MGLRCGVPRAVTSVLDRGRRGRATSRLQSPCAGVPLSWLRQHITSCCVATLVGMRPLCHGFPIWRWPCASTVLHRWRPNNAPPHTHTHHHHHFYDQSRIFGRWEGQWLWSLDTSGCAVRLSRLMHEEVLHLCSTLVFGAYCRATKVSRSACEEVLHFHTVCPSDHLCLALLQFCLC
jgi:hypothetical protein